MKSKTHVYMANMLIEDIKTGKFSLPKIGEYTIPAQVKDSILKYPGAFRAGALGPDFCPDMIIGQMSMHPEFSGKWLELMFNQALLSPSEHQNRNFAFIYGYMTHYAGDMFGHDYVNSYAKGWFPSFTDVVKDNEKAKVIARHILVESYMDKFVPANTDISLDVPYDFLLSCFLSAEGRAMMSKYANSQYNLLKIMAEYLDSVHSKSLESTIGMLPGITDYVQRWETDVKEAMHSWLVLWGNIAYKFLTNDSGKITYLKDELKNWFVKKGLSMIGFPDWFSKVLTWTKIFEPIEECIKQEVKKLLIPAINAMTGGLYNDIDQALTAFQTYLKDPKLAIDSGYVFDGVHTSDKLLSDFGNYGKTNDTNGQTFKAVSQCLNMSKLCLLGADNLNKIYSYAGAGAKYSNCKTKPSAYVAYVRVKTKNGSFFDTFGTDNNVYAGITYSKGQKYEVLLDKAGYNDLEKGDDDTYSFTLSTMVPLDEVTDIYVRMSGGLSDDWTCSFIRFYDRNKRELFNTISEFKLSNGQVKTFAANKVYDKNVYQSNVIPVDHRIISFLYSLDGKGESSANPAIQHQWEIGFDIFSNASLYKNLFCPLFGDVKNEPPVIDPQSIFAKKFDASLVFDCQRSPVYPESGKPFTACSLVLPYKESGGQYTKSELEGRYFAFKYDQAASSLVMYLCGKDGETKVSSGTIYGIGDKGFLYVSTRGYGYFFSMIPGCSVGSSVSYTPTTGKATLADLEALFTEKAGIFAKKFDASLVFDCQRSPVYPESGKPFTARSLVLPYKESGGQYTKSELESRYFAFKYDQAASSLVMYLCGKGGETKVSSGTIYGIGDKGFLYVSTRGYGYFFSMIPGCSVGSSVSYTPTIGKATLEQLKKFN